MITEPMMQAGRAALEKGMGWANDWDGMLRAVYTAMSQAAPEDAGDLNVATIYNKRVDRFALRLALPGRKEWPPHYPDDRKEYWRRVVRDIAVEIAMSNIEDAKNVEVESADPNRGPR